VGEGQDTTGHPSTARVSVQEAAEHLGTTVDAIRKRVQRGTIAHDKDEHGRVWILLDTDRTRHAIDQDSTGQRQDSESGALISEMRGRIEDLRDQLEAERQAHAESRRLLMAALERIPPQLAAPQEPTEAAETADEPEWTEPRPAAGGRAQEDAAGPQQRGRWREPVDKLPWWPYVLGLVAMVVGVVAGKFEYYRWDTQFAWIITWLGVPSSMGIWAGFKQRYVRVWRREVPLGAILGVAFVSIVVLSDPEYAFSDFFHDPIAGTLFCAYFIAPSLLLYVSGVLIGNARQRRLTGRRSGTIPASPLSRTMAASTGSGTGWTPRKQAILGFVGTVLAALLGLMGTIVGAIMASGG
jgi:hypothetical protein